MFSRDFENARQNFVDKLNAEVAKRTPPPPAETDSANDDPAVMLTRYERAVMDYKNNVALHAEAKAFFESKTAEIHAEKKKLLEIQAKRVEIGQEIENAKKLANSFSCNDLDAAQSKLEKQAEEEKRLIDAAESSQLEKTAKLEKDFRSMRFGRLLYSDLPKLLNESNFVTAVFFEKEELFKLAIDTDPVIDFLRAFIAFKSLPAFSNPSFSIELQKYYYGDICKELEDLIFSTLFELPKNKTANPALLYERLDAIAKSERGKISTLLKSEIEPPDMEFKEAA